MRSRLQMLRFAGSALLAVLAIQFVPSQAMAAKEKFERTKPHVNVGTIGDAAGNASQLTTTGNGGDATTQQPAQDCGEPNPATATDTRRAC